MEEPNRKEEKLEGGEIHMRSAMRPAREHGRLYKWFDNFWYHHKWKTVIGLFFTVVILVCTLQMCQKEEAGDISVVLAGPYAFEEEVAYNNFRSCISLYIPEECDEDGDGRRADMIVYTLYSSEQITALREHVDENGDPDPIEVNTIANSQDYNKYNEYMMTGETSVLFLDPWLFEELAGKGEYLVDLSEVYGKTPEGAVFSANASGEEKCLGVRLGDTALYQNNSAIRVLSEDTVLCLMGPYFIGKSSDEAEYQKAVKYFAALAGIK